MARVQRTDYEVVEKTLDLAVCGACGGEFEDDEVYSVVFLPKDARVDKNQVVHVEGSSSAWVGTNAVRYSVPLKHVLGDGVEEDVEYVCEDCRGRPDIIRRGIPRPTYTIELDDSHLDNFAFGSVMAAAFAWATGTYLLTGSLVLAMMATVLGFLITALGGMLLGVLLS